MAWQDFGTGEIQGPPTNDPAPVTQELLEKYLDRDRAGCDQAIHFATTSLGPLSLTSDVTFQSLNVASVRVPESAELLAVNLREAANATNAPEAANPVVKVALDDGTTEVESATRTMVIDAFPTVAYFFDEFAALTVPASHRGQIVTLKAYARRGSTGGGTIRYYVEQNQVEWGLRWYRTGS